MKTIPIKYEQFNHYLIDENGTVYSTLTPRYRKVLDKPKVRKHWPNEKNGYHQVTLQNGHLGVKPKLYYVHRLVAEHFIPNPDNLPEVNHKDWDITNNHVSNLEWISLVDNRLDRNPRNSPFKIKQEQIRNNPQLLQQGIELYLSNKRKKSVLRKFWGLYNKLVIELLEENNIDVKYSKNKIF
jgi:hypothetical protein